MSSAFSTTRREALKRLGASSLLTLGLWPGCQAPQARAGGRRFRFLAVNDLHHGGPGCDPWFEALTRQLRTHGDAEFVLLLGDLADNAEPASHAAIRDHFRTLGKPVFTQVGNHDLPATGDRRSYDSHFPQQVNYRFGHRGWSFIGIDSTDGTLYENTRIQPPTLAWLDEQLPKLDPRKPTVLFTHFPLGAGVKMTPLNSDAVLQRFLPFNLRGVFSGHYHAYTEREFRGIDVVTNRCCSRLRGNHDGTTEKGYWLVTAEDGRLSREFIRFQGPA